MRIIGGEWRRRVLQTPTWAGLRPTSDRLRETLYNVLAHEVPGADVLDAYAGTGAVGLEALSRGARHVTFVERDRRAVALIAANVSKCGVAERYTVLHRDADTAWRSGNLGLFDIVFLDPPYDASHLDTTLEGAAHHVARQGVLVLEHAWKTTPPPRAGKLTLTRQLRQGDSALAFYRPVEPVEHGAVGGTAE